MRERRDSPNSLGSVNVFVGPIVKYCRDCHHHNDQYNAAKEQSVVANISLKVLVYIWSENISSNGQFSTYKYVKIK
jgi:hypothetical protein